MHISHLYHLALWRFYRCAVSLFFTVLSVGRSVLLQYIDTQQRIWRVTAVGRKPVRSPKRLGPTIGTGGRIVVCCVVRAPLDLLFAVPYFVIIMIIATINNVEEHTRIQYTPHAN